MTIAELNQKHAIPGAAEIVAAGGNLPAVRISGPAHALIYLHGAHVAQWHPAGAKEVLWMSGQSLFADGKPIRGGVPICYPWFGPLGGVAGAATHGFVRNSAWELEAIRKVSAGVEVVLKLASDGASRGVWPHDFVLRHRITAGNELSMALELANTGHAPFKAEEALHTYFTVGDIRQTRVQGLAGTHYIDKVDGKKEKTQAGDIDFTGETDRVYFDTPAPAVIEDPVLRRRITISKEGSRDTVVWNPWIAKAKAMADFGDDEWTGMVCVETCNVAGNAVEVAAGSTVRMTARIAVQNI
ncbi:MAG TPA: D-hexose-6-phosphate mutarotase [Phycisphaerae bacterium]|nr:D-hexose-6-phosphate mutarotase [Phycisphaerae bacterium]